MRPELILTTVIPWSKNQRPGAASVGQLLLFVSKTAKHCSNVVHITAAGQQQILCGYLVKMTRGYGYRIACYLERYCTYNTR